MSATYRCATWQRAAPINWGGNEKEKLLWERWGFVLANDS